MTMQEESARVSIQLDEDVERVAFEINGTEYHLKHGWELPMEHQLFLARVGSRMSGLDDPATIQKLTDADIAGMSRDLRKAVGYLNHDVPVELFNKLHDAHLLQIVSLFQTAPIQAATSEPSASSSQDSAATIPA